MDFSSWSREGLHMSLLRLRCSLSSCIPTSAAFPPNKAATDRILLVFAKMQLVEAWWCSGKELECGREGCGFDSFLDSLPKSAWGYTGLCIQPFVTRMQWHINEHKLNFEYWIFRCFHQSLSMGSSIHWSMDHHSSKTIDKNCCKLPLPGLRQCNIVTTTFGAKDCSTYDYRFFTLWNFLGNGKWGTSWQILYHSTLTKLGQLVK